jgi:hypothetical protein
MTRAVTAAMLVLAAANLSTAASIGALAQEPKLAPEGRGLLPKSMATGLPPEPTETRPGGLTSFQVDPSGGLSRTIFETDEDQHFRFVIRDFSFPPDQKPHTITLPFGAVVYLPSGPVENNVAKPGATTVVPPGAPIEVVNNGEYPVIVRTLIVEAK